MNWTNRYCRVVNALDGEVVLPGPLLKSQFWIGPGARSLFAVSSNLNQDVRLAVLRRSDRQADRRPGSEEGL